MNQHDILTSLDHPVIAVRDMGKARLCYERLGFTIPPRGSHVEWGTGNWCIMFAENYLELRGIIDPKKYTHGLNEFLERRTGLMGLALGTSDANRSHDLLAKRGLLPQPVRTLTRNFELPGGTVHPRFSLCFLEPQETPGLMSIVLCQHLTPELLRRPEWLEHDNGARSVVAMSGVVADLKSATERLAKLFGQEAIEIATDRLTISVGRNQQIVLYSLEAAKKEYHGCGINLDTDFGHLTAVQISVYNLDRTREFLKLQRIACQQTSEGFLRVLPEEACGTMIEFVP